MADLYEVLQVHRHAEFDVIRAAYRALARKHHPDFGGDGARMVAINDAWRVLSDREARAAYDAQLASSQARRSSDRMVSGPIAGYAPSPARSAPATPGNDGTIIDFGRYAGWSVGKLVEHDPDYLEWLARTPIGRRLANEIEGVLAHRASQFEALRPTGTT
ncbi:MAG: J domain-containing protein, partial [Chloroflexi bacterium]|nr:J domain-containing protein [Chloroflexota bacterium]